MIPSQNGVPLSGLRSPLLSFAYHLCLQSIHFSLLPGLFFPWRRRVEILLNLVHHRLEPGAYHIFPSLFHHQPPSFLAYFPSSLPA